MPIRFPDFYGIDTPQQIDLMAANMTVEEMRIAIGADYLGFLPVAAMVRATGLPKESLNLVSFTGEYPVDIGKHRANIKEPVSRNIWTSVSFGADAGLCTCDGREDVII